MKVNYEVELTTTGFIQVEVPEGLDEDEIEEYLSDNVSVEDITYELDNGQFSSETVEDYKILQNSGYLEEEYL